jgi:hypothetical protein
MIAITAVRLASSTSSRAAVTRLAASERAALEHPLGVQLLYSTRALPSAVKSACAAVMSDHRFQLADPGKPYNETDTDVDDRIPDRRLLWVARLPEHFVLHYESGGRAHSFHIIVVRSANSRAHVVGRAAADVYKDYSAFVRALKRNKPDDTLDYMF